MLGRRNKWQANSAKRYQQYMEATRIAQEAAGIPVFDPRKVTRFEVALQIEVDRLEPQITYLLRALGQPEGLVTDESLVWDMEPDDRKLRGLRRKLKLRVSANDYIYAVAEKLLARGKGK